MPATSPRPRLGCLAALFLWPVVAMGQSAGPKSSPPSASAGPLAASGRPVLPPAVQKAAKQFDRAMTLVREHKPAPAVAALKEFVRLAADANLPPQASLPAYRALVPLYSMLGDTVGLESALRHIVATDKNDALAWTQIAAVEVQKKQIAAARADADRALRLKPEKRIAASAHFVLGDVALGSSDNVAAEKEFAATLQATPENVQARFNLGIALARQKKFAAALTELVKVRSSAPRLFAARLFIAGIKQEQHDFTGALAAYDDLIAVDPHNVAALFNRADVLEHIGKDQEAISGFLSVLQLAPNNLAAQFDAAQLYYNLSNYKAARIHYEAALKIDPKDVRVLSGLALAESQEAFGLGDPTSRQSRARQAEAVFKQALTLVPTDAALQDGLGSLYERMNRYEDALALYNKQRQAAPNKVDAYYRVGRVYAMQRKTSEFLASWKQYRDNNPDDPISYEESAQMLERDARWEDALAEWNRLLARHPKTGVKAGVLVAMGKELVSLKRNDEARARFKETLELKLEMGSATQPLHIAEKATLEAEQQDALQHLAQLAEADKKSEEAIAYWNQLKPLQAADALQRGQPIEIVAYLAIARIYEQDKKPDLAIQELNTLSSATPTDPRPYEALGKLLGEHDRLEEAAVAYTKAAARSKTPLDDSLKVAEMYENHGKPLLALALYKELQPRYSNDPAFLIRSAAAYEAAGKNEEALAAYDAAQKTNAREFWINDKRAILLGRLHRYEEARAAYVAELNAHPDQFQTYSDVRLVFGEEGKADAYLPWLQARFEKTPAVPTLMSAVMDAYVREKRENAGWEYVHGVVGKHTSERPVQEAYASSLAARNHGKEAIAVRRRIAERYPADPLAQFTLAQQLDADGQQDAATRIYEAFAASKELSRKDRMGIQWTLADRFADQKKFSESAAILYKIAMDSPDDFRAKTRLAEVLVLAKRYDEAIPIYTSLTTFKQYPSRVKAQLYDRIAAIHEKQGENSEAITAFQEALVLNAHDALAAEGLKRLQPK